MTAPPTEDWHAALRAHPVHALPPVGDPYVLGRWHKDRASWKGYAFEARVHAKGLLGRHDLRKFLMVGRPRSGTTLLARLLNQVQGVHCDGEVLHHAVLAPRAFLNRLASIKPARAYGAKLISYQMFEVQKIAEPPRFFQDLIADGFTLVHLRRETFAQSLSLSVAQSLQHYHIKSSGPVAERRVEIDPQAFLRQVEWNRLMLDYEDQLFAALPHIRVEYEADLRGADSHQATVDRICAALGLPASPVTADLQKTGDRTVVENKPALFDALRTAGLEALLPAEAS